MCDRSAPLCRLLTAHERLRVNVALENLELTSAGDECACSHKIKHRNAVLTQTGSRGRTADAKVICIQEALATGKENTGFLEEFPASGLYRASCRVCLFKDGDVVVFRLDGDDESSQRLVVTFWAVESSSKAQLQETLKFH
jgi:hypothetical protein